MIRKFHDVSIIFLIAMVSWPSITKIQANIIWEHSIAIFVFKGVKEFIELIISILRANLNCLNLQFCKH